MFIPLIRPYFSNALNSLNKTIHYITQNYFSSKTILTLIIAISIALLLGRLIATILRKVVTIIGKRADKTQNLNTVNRLRHYETIIVLSIALIRSALIIVALYIAWQYLYPNSHPTAFLGASALVIVIGGGILSSPLRDMASGSLMMAEQWYGVGDHIKVDPFNDLQGLVERVTLRSTKIRGLNGEVIWLNNQYIHGVRISPRGIRTIGLEIFVTNLKAGEQLINKTNKRLPLGPLLVVSPLTIVQSLEVGDQLWQITAVGETAPGREWLIEVSATELIKLMDQQSKNPVIAHGPLARYADQDAERKFTRSISNSRKKPIRRKPSISKSMKK